MSDNPMSPERHAQLSGQYLEQLERLERLLNKSGVLSNSEFDEQKEITLANIKKINNA